MIIRTIYRPRFGFWFKPYQLSISLYQKTNGLGLLTWFSGGITWNEFYYHLVLVIFGYGVNIAVSRR